MAHHELKILPKYFDAVVSGVKNFEVRKDDRGYEVDDTLDLLEYDGNYTGQRLSGLKVVYVLRNSDGLADGYCVLGLM